MKNTYKFSQYIFPICKDRSGRMLQILMLLVLCLASSPSSIFGQTTVTLGAANDTYIAENNSNNFGACVFMQVNGANISPLERGLLRFDLSSIPSNATITSATLSLTNTNGNPASNSIGVYRVTNAWIPGTACDGSIQPASWTQRTASANWTTAGGDFNAAAEATTTLAGGFPTTYSWNITNMVQNWVNGTNPNHGLLVKPTNDAINALKTFGQSETSNPANRPSLTITYTTCAISPANPDTDGDGIANSCDSDDDNDGILDIAEGAADCTPQLLDWSAVADGSGILTYPINISGANVSIQSFNTVAHPNSTLGPLNGTVGISGSSTGQFIPVQIIPDAVNDGATSTLEFSTAVKNFYFDMYDLEWRNDTENDEWLTIETYLNGVSVPVTAANFSNIGANVEIFNGNTARGRIETGDAVGSDPNHVVRFSINSFVDEIRFVWVMGDRNASDGNTQTWVTATTRMSDFSLCATVTVDTDGDGLIDALDNDSDNEGCADAIEGGGSFTSANIDGNGRLTGGVNPTTGIPTAAGAGQTIGGSQVATQLTVNTPPSNQTVTAPAAASFTIATTASNNTSWSGPTNARIPVYGTPGNANAQTVYQWWLGNPDAGGTQLTNTGVYSGVTTATLNISNTTGLSGNVYYIVVTNSNNSCIREVRSASLLGACTPGPGNPDTDGDGVADVCDQDDDNDGILDVNEGTTVVPGGLCFGFDFNATAQGWVQQNNNAGATSALTHSSSTSTFNGCSIPAGAPGGGNYILEDDFAGGSVYFESPDNLNTNLSNAVGGSLSYWWINGVRDGSGTQASNMQNIVLTGGGISVSTSINITGEINTGWKNKTILLTDAVWSGSAADLLAVLTDLDRIEIQVEDIIGSIGPGDCNPIEYFGLDGVSITCASSSVAADTDGDGNPNALDTDSDNDGCADAIEGGGSFTAASIDGNGRLTGGVNPTTGIPTVAGAGQTIGGSQVAAQLTVNTAPSNQTVLPGAAASFSIATTASNNTSWSGPTNARVPVYGSPGNANAQTQYQWYLGNPDAGGVALTNVGVYSNVTTATLNISNSTGLFGNVYYVVVTHSNNSCIREVRNATLILSCVDLIITPTLTQPACFAFGGITLSVSGGTAPYTYDWADIPGASNVKDRSGLSAGTYNLTFTDANGCNVAFNSVLTLVAPINCGPVTVCQNDPNSVFSVTPHPDNLSYTWTVPMGATIVNGQGTPSITVNWSGATPGVRQVCVVANNVCGTSAQTCQDVNIVAPPVPNPMVGPACEGSDIQLFASGGGTYNWSSNSASAFASASANPIIPNASANNNGLYSVTVTNTAGCVATGTVAVTVTPSPQLSVATTNNATCGQSNGVVNLTVTSGTPTFTYAWSNGAVTEDLSNVPSGNYQVTVTDVAGCTAVLGTNISDSPGPVLTHTSTPVSCFGGSNGTIDLTITGGVLPRTILWFNNGSTMEDQSGLAAGIYGVIVTDATGCVAARVITITEPDAITLDFTKVDVNCFNGATGSINLIVAGGTGTYSYSWTKNGNPFGGNMQDLSSLGFGTYAVTVTDANLCTATTTVTITQPAVALSATAAVTNVDCFGGSNGQVILTVTDGTEPYMYAWTGPGGFTATTKDIVGRIAGSYNVIVTDAKGCTFPLTGIMIGQPALLAVSSAIPANVSCFGGANGSINATITGGTTAYTYLWSNGAIVQDPSGLTAGNYTLTVTDLNGCTAVSGSIAVGQPAQPLAIVPTVTNVNCFGASTGSINLAVTGGSGSYTFAWLGTGTGTNPRTGLAAGNYTVTVTDANLCTATLQVAVTQNTQIAATSSITNVSCNGGNNGSIALNVNGGNGTYTYNWSGTGTGSNPRTGLTAGTYNVTVSDGLGCQAPYMFTITQPAALTLNSTVPMSPLCNGDISGSIDLTVNGGTAPYLYVWSNGTGTQDIALLMAGTYSVTVTDDKGCTATRSQVVNQPAAIVVTPAKVDVACFGAATGSINLGVTGGTGAYTFAWSGPSGFASGMQNISALAAGTYTVTVTDANSCKAITEVIILQNNRIAISGDVTNINCFGTATGGINLLVSGGNGTYTYTWSDGPNMSATRTGLSAGTYNVTVQDGLGCMSMASFLIEQPTAALSASKIDINPFCNGASSGSIDLTVVGGTPNYTYAWSDGPSTSQDRMGLAAGTYLVTVTDSKGCTAVSESVLVNPPQFTVSVSLIKDVTCKGGNDGSATATPTNGTALFSYLWSNGFMQQTPTNFTAGTYSVTATDANGCVAQAGPITIEEPTTMIMLSAVATASYFCGTGTGTIDLTVTDAVGPFTYAWSGTGVISGQEDQTGLTPGTYTVVVKDNIGCTAMLNVEVPSTLVLGSPICEPSGTTYSVTFSETSGAIITVGPGSYTITGNIISGIPLGINLLVTATNPNDPNCFITLTATSPVTCNICDNLISVAGAVCAPDFNTYTVNFLLAPGSILTRSPMVGTVTANAITGIPAGTNITLTVTNPSCGATMETIPIKAPDCCPDAPVASVGPAVCVNSSTYQYTFVASPGATAVSTNGTVVGNTVTVAVGTNDILTVFKRIGCEAVTLSVTSPASCNNLTCVQPNLTVGNSVCVNGTTYSVTFTETTGAIITTGPDTYTITGNIISGIQVGEDVQITATNPSDPSCSITLTATSPDDCTQTCPDELISVSAQGVCAPNFATYTVYFTLAPGATLTTVPVVGTIGANSITGIPAGTASIRLIATSSACNKVDDIIVMAPNCNSTYAQNDINQTPINVLVSGNVLYNDNDPQGDDQTVTAALADTDGDGLVDENLPLGTATTVYGTNNNNALVLAGTVMLNSDGSYTYTPALNFTGKVPFAYTITDDNTPAASDAATVSIEVIPASVQGVNEPPVANDDTNGTERDVNVSGNVRLNDSDPDGDPITVTSALADTDGDGQVDDNLPVGTSTPIFGLNASDSPVAAGSITLNSNGTYTFDPLPTFIGEVPVRYTISDPGNLTDNAVLTITVTENLGNATYANDDANVGPQAAAQTGNVLQNDSDPESNTQTVTAATNSNNTALVVNGLTANPLPSGGTLVLAANGAYTYTPAANFTGTEVVRYTASDNGSPIATDVATLYLTTLPINNTYAQNDINQTPINTPANGNVLTNDNDPQGNAQTVAAALADTDGDGSVDDNLPLATLTTIYGRNDANTLVVAGQVTLAANGTYTYTPALNFTGDVPFAYTVTDNNANPATDRATVGIEVVPITVPGVNEPPVANDDTNGTEKDVNVGGNVRLNDSDPDGDPITVTSALADTDGDGQVDDNLPVGTATPIFGSNVSDSPVAAGSITLNSNGTYTFDPLPTFIGEVPVRYTISDPGNLTDNAVLTITVTENLGNATYANDDANVGPQAAAQTGNVLQNDSDPESNTQTVTAAANSNNTALVVNGVTANPLPSGGTLVLAANGAYTYTPAANFTGTEVVRYTASDNGSPFATDVATLYLTTLPLNVALLNVKIMLQGALYNTSNGLMRDDLRTGGHIPLQEPYTDLGTSFPKFTHQGAGGGETTNAGVLAANAGTPNAIVDWVFVELRSATDATQVLETRSALVQRDGDVVSAADGISLLAFPGKVGQSYFVSVKHRNHLGAMLAAPVVMSSDGSVADFITATAAQLYDRPGVINYDGYETVTVQGKTALWAGNANVNNKVKYQGTGSDLSPMLAQVLAFPGNTSSAYNYNLAFGYYTGDINMDGKVKYQGTQNDATFIFTNVVGLYPLNTATLYNYDLFIEQLP